jgi:beta-xylosidase
MVLKVGGTYYLYYAGADQEGKIIGVATANSPLGPWTDLGSVIPTDPDIQPESPTVVFRDGLYYLFYSDPNQGAFYRTGINPIGPWSDASALTPGWAHEVWQTA